MSSHDTGGGRECTQTPSNIAGIAPMCCGTRIWSTDKATPSTHTCGASIPNLGNGCSGLPENLMWCLKDWYMHSCILFCKKKSANRLPVWLQTWALCTRLGTQGGWWLERIPGWWWNCGFTVHRSYKSIRFNWPPADVAKATEYRCWWYWACVFPKLPPWLHAVCRYQWSEVLPKAN